MVDESSAVFGATKANAVVVCFSGKRKSGKDFVARRLAQLLVKSGKMRVSTCAISDPLKDEFAKLHGMDADRLKTDGEYKETVRAEMVTFGERLRAQDTGYFCKKALLQRQPIVGENLAEFDRPEVILVSDCRRPSDLEFFQIVFSHRPNSVLLIRVESSLETRQNRGFTLVPRIDDAATECALDNFKGWDFCIRNKQDDRLDLELAKVVERLNGMIMGLR